MIVDRCDECGKTRPFFSSLDDWFKLTPYGQFSMSNTNEEVEHHFCSKICLKKWAVSH